MKDLQVLKIGLLSMQVCTNIKKRSEIELLANSVSLCGTANGWSIDEKLSKKLGQSKVECSEREGYFHYILYA